MSEERYNSAAEPGNRQPLVLAGSLLLAGLALEHWMHLGAWTVGLGAGVFCLWGALEMRRAGSERLRSVLLGMALVLAGAGVWAMNQEMVASRDVVRFLGGKSEEVAVTVRMRVIVPPELGEERNGTFRNAAWVGRVEEILTDRGWMEAAGDVAVRARAGAQVRGGEKLEVCGWMARPTQANNPGGPDRRATLAADRVFVAIRVREGGVRVLEAGDSGRWLERGRLWLRGKLLDRVALLDVPSGYTLAALLLGYRDPAITGPGSVSQSFSDAGVAHLLAISGSHLALVAGALWLVLRWVPIRPAWRAVLMAAIVGAYVLATPCGPPILRAAVVMGVVLLTRLWRRPLQPMNMLMLAAVVIVLLRPADVLDAGFQLSFVTTAGLIVFGRRLYDAWFGRWAAREGVIVAISGAAYLRLRFRTLRGLAALTVANLIGSATAAPLVMMWFGQINGWSVLTGLAAMPLVVMGMFMAAVQVLAEICSLGAWTAPATAWAGKAMIKGVSWMAQWPGASITVRPLAGGVAALIYAALLAWALRRRWGVSRAAAVNVLLGMVVVVAGWYAWTGAARSSRVSIAVMDAGTSSAMLLRLPDGRLWAINAGVAQGSDVATMFVPAMRREGARSLAGVVVTALDASHGAGAGELVRVANAGAVVAPAGAWAKRGQTLAGTSLEHGAAEASAKVRMATAGKALELSDDVRLEILVEGQRGLVVLLTYAGGRVLVADAGDVEALLRVGGVRCDAVIFTGPSRGAADGDALSIAKEMGAKTIVWSGRGSWAERKSRAGEWNTVEGAVCVEVDTSGVRAGRWR